MNEADFPEAFKRYGGDLEVMIMTASMIAEDAPIENLINRIAESVS